MSILSHALLASTALLALCGDHDTRTSRAAAGSDEPPAPVDACGVVSAEFMQQALGGALSEPLAGEPFIGDDGSVNTCSWRTADNSAGLTLSVRTSRYFRASAGAYDTYADDWESQMGTRPRVQSVTGLGSAAIWDQSNHILMARASKAGYEVSVQPFLANIPMVELEAARTVVAEALEHLP